MKRPLPHLALTLCLLSALLIAAPLTAEERTGISAIYGSLSDLESAAERYREIVDAGGWPEIGSGPVLEPGDRGPRVEKLRELLAITGDLDESGSPDNVEDPQAYTEEVAAAVERFQKRHHILVDGLVGPGTLEALQVPAEKRLEQLEAAIETRRELAERKSLAEPDDPLAILINLPEYRLHLLENGSPTLTMAVAIGEAGWQTPLLREKLETIVVNPYWYVPIEIIAAEIAPKAEEDPSYLESRGLEIAKSASPDAELVDPGSIDWASVTESDPDSFPYYLRHAPGPENPLGRIKFRLPNNESIYLHDTPGEEVFGDPRRAVSHGCIRLEKPIELGERLIAEVEGWDTERLRQALDEGTHRHLPLARELPVDSIYLVAWANGDGTVHFTDTPYGLSGPDQVVRDPEAGSEASTKEGTET